MESRPQRGISNNHSRKRRFVDRMSIVSVLNNCVLIDPRFKAIPPLIGEILLLILHVCMLLLMLRHRQVIMA